VASLGGEATLLLLDPAGKAVSDQASRVVFALMGERQRADGPAPRWLGPFQDSLATKYLAYGVSASFSPTKLDKSTSELRGL
jgi:hypothetical protein